MTRIAIIYLGRRGAGGRISLELAQNLQNMADVTAAISTFGEVQAAWRQTSVPLIETETFQSARQALFSLLFPAKINALVEEIRAFRPDVLVFPMAHPWNAALQKRLDPVPAIVFSHDPQPHPDFAGWFYAQLETPSLRRAACCIVLSEALKPALAQRGVDEKRMDILPLGLLDYSQAGWREKAPSQPPTLLFFGRIVPYKGLEVLIESYRLVRETHSARLLIAGDGDLSAQRNMLDSLPDVEIVNRWIGEDEIGAFFGRADLVVLPYTSASQSGVIPIAASFGLPVVATRTGGIPEQIEHGKTGWLVAPGSARALAEALVFAIEHPVEAQQIGAALQAEFSASRNWVEIARKLLKIVESL